MAGASLTKRSKVLSPIAVCSAPSNLSRGKPCSDFFRWRLQQALALMFEAVMAAGGEFKRVAVARNSDAVRGKKRSSRSAMTCRVFFLRLCV